MFYMEVRRFSIGRNIIKCSSISTSTSSIKNRHTTSIVSEDKRFYSDKQKDNAYVGVRARKERRTLCVRECVRKVRIFSLRLFDKQRVYIYEHENKDKVERRARVDRG